MATWSITGRESLLTVLGRRLSRTRLLTVAVLQLIARTALTVAGLALFSAAAWLVAVPLGLVVAGASCLVLEWAIKRSP